MKNISKISRAFTLVETLIAIGVFGIGVLAIVSFYAYSSKTVQLARQITIATNLDQSLIEAELALPYDSLIATQGIKEAYSTDTNSPYRDYQKKITINYIDANLNISATDLGLKKIDCFIYWQSGLGEKSIALSTIATKK